VSVLADPDTTLVWRLLRCVDEPSSLSQAFARLSAVYGGTYMLSKPDLEVVYSGEGVATGVQSEGETAKAKFVVGDPSELSSPTVMCGAGSLMKLAIRKTCGLHCIKAQDNTHMLHALRSRAGRWDAACTWRL
jgi:RAB protein geranylgeranyltransferase component A